MVYAPVSHLEAPPDFDCVRTITHPLPTGCLASATHPSSSCPLFFAATKGAVHVFNPDRATAVHQYSVSPVDGEARTGTTLCPLDENVLLVGDDTGAIHLFDIRKPFSSVTALTSTLDQGDYISSMSHVDRFGTQAVLATSGDGTVCAYDIRNPPNARVKLQYATDAYNDDLLSLAILDNTPLAVAGTLSGSLNLYNLHFLDVDADVEAAAHVDRFHGHPECVNAVLSCAHDDLVITASSDGFVRVLDVVNKTLLGVLDYRLGIQQDGEEEGSNPRNLKRNRADSRWPIESMVAIQATRAPTFALLCHDDFIRFCDGSALVDDDDDDDDSEGGDGQVESRLPCEENSCQNDDDIDRSRPQNEKRLSLPPEAELGRGSKRSAKKRKGKDHDTTSGKRKSDGFFDDL